MLNISKVYKKNKKKFNRAVSKMFKQIYFII